MIGVHVAKSSHVFKVPARKTMLGAIQQDCEGLKLGACQIFVQGPRNSKMSSMNYEDIKKYCDSKITNV